MRAILTTNGCINLTTWQLDDDDDDQGQQQQQQGQQQGKDPVRARLKQLEKENRDLLEKVTRAEAAQRTTSLKEILAGKKRNPKLATLIPSNVDSTPEAIEAWLKDYADLFPAQASPQTPDDDGSDDTGDNNPGDMDQQYVDTINAMARMAAASNNAAAPKTKPEDLYRKIIDPDLKHDDLVKLIQAHGGGVGMG